jgi:hypothetical protein
MPVPNITELDSKKDTYLLAQVSLVQRGAGTPFWIQSDYLGAIRALPENIVILSTEYEEDGGDDLDVAMRIADLQVQKFSARHLSILAALLEVGAPAAVLTRRSLSDLGCLAINPAWHMHTEEDAATRSLCDFLGIGQSKRPDGQMQLHSDGIGQSPRQYCYSPSVDVAHISLLIVSAMYWDLLPARLKKQEFLVNELPGILGAETVQDISRPHIFCSVMSQFKHVTDEAEAMGGA